MSVAVVTEVGGNKAAALVVVLQPSVAEAPLGPPAQEAIGASDRDRSVSLSSTFGVHVLSSLGTIGEVDISHRDPAVSSSSALI